MDEQKLIDALNETLSDLWTGPLSNAGYVNCMGANADDELEVRLGGVDIPFTIDTPQLARDIIQAHDNGELS